MTDKNKPEWFEIAEADAPVQIRKVKKSLPIAAVVASLLIIGVGALVAQTQEEPPANATETSASATDQTPAPSSASNETTATDTSISSNTSTPSKTPTKQSAKPSASPTQSTNLQNPSIAKLPTKGGEDDENEGREHHGDRESHSEGDDD